MTSQITSAIAPGIVAAEVQRAEAKDAGELGGWERLMRAHWHILRFNPEDFREGIRLLERYPAQRTEQRGGAVRSVLRLALFRLAGMG